MRGRARLGRRRRQLLRYVSHFFNKYSSYSPCTRPDNGETGRRTGSLCTGADGPRCVSAPKKSEQRAHLAQARRDITRVYRTSRRPRGTSAAPPVQTVCGPHARCGTHHAPPSSGSHTPAFETQAIRLPSKMARPSPMSMHQRRPGRVCCPKQATAQSGAHADSALVAERAASDAAPVCPPAQGCTQPRTGKLPS